MSEKRLAKKDGAKLVKNSGRGWQKGDAILSPPLNDGCIEFLLDYKEYTSSFSISKKNWEKHKMDAWNQKQREACISLVLDGETRLAIIDWQTFMYLLENTWLCEGEYGPG